MSVVQYIQYCTVKSEYQNVTNFPLLKTKFQISHLKLAIITWRFYSSSLFLVS